jgi:hypothetical protein
MIDAEIDRPATLLLREEAGIMDALMPQPPAWAEALLGSRLSPATEKPYPAICSRNTARA